MHILSSLAILVFLLIYVSSCFSYNPTDYGQINTENLVTSQTGGPYNYAVANFGPKMKYNCPQCQGILHNAVPEEACGRVEPPPPDKYLPVNYGWIAVVKRSRQGHRNACNFIDKVLNAQKSGYNYVIIYNYERDDGSLNVMAAPQNKTLLNMVKIPSVYVDYEAGLEMALLSFPNLNPNQTAAYFLPFDDGISPYQILIPMAFSFVGILLITCIVMIVRWCQAVRRKRRSRISKSQLKKIPVGKYEKGDQYDCCAICLEDYEEGEKLRVLPCAHTFHQKCIDPWLLKNKRTCPVCKRKVMPKPARRRRRRDDSSDSSDSNEDIGTDERTPLLPPPAGSQGQRSQQSDTAEGSQLYGSGLPTAIQSETVYDNDSSDDEPGLATNAVRQTEVGSPDSPHSILINYEEITSAHGPCIAHSLQTITEENEETDSLLQPSSSGLIPDQRDSEPSGAVSSNETQNLVV